MEWDVVSLSDMCSKIFAGGDVPKGNYSKYKTDKYTVPIFANGEKNKGLYGYTNIEKVTKPSITVSARGTIGYSEIRREPFYPIVRLIVLSPNLEVVDLEFLKYIVQSMNFINSGTSIPQLTVPMIKGYKSVLPPIPEQKRIVAILDEAFAGISQAVANAEKNLANARELFESYLNNVFTQKGEGWVEMPLKHFTKSISTDPFGSLLHKSDYVTSGVPLVNPINIVDGVIIPNPSKLIDQSTKNRLGSYVLSEGDIVIGRRGEIGRCAVVGNEQDGWICGTGCFFVRPLSEVNPEFLAHLLRSNTYSMKLESVATGATMKNISNKALSNLSVCIPSLEIQTRILSRFSILKHQTKHLETIYKQKLTALTELKQSVLQKAFTGELTTEAILQQANG